MTRQRSMAAAAARIASNIGGKERTGCAPSIIY
jgi:hypothetical protein